MNILVLEGGDSSERDVSFRSAAAVKAALERAGYSVTTYDPKDGLEGLLLNAQKSDLVMPIIHGENCEDGIIQKALEEKDIPFLGAGSIGSKQALSKELTHEILDKKGIRMPDYEVITSAQYTVSRLAEAPHVLKTIDGGSSLGCLIAREISSDTVAKAKILLSAHHRMIIEELVEGIELTVGVLGDKSLPVIAITPPADGEFDYENKYNGKTTEICPVPEDILSAKQQQEAQQLALKVHAALGARHLSRTDMIFTRDGLLYVLELNTIPGMTDQSLYPKAALAEGIPMVELVDRFVKLVKN